MPRIDIDMRSYRWVGYGTLSFFLIFSVAAIRASQYWPSVGFAAFAFVGLYITTSAGSYALTLEFISYESRLGCWRIHWAEVASAQFSAMGTLLLLGHDKRFVLSPSTWWPRSIRLAATTFVSERLKEQHITPLLSHTADYRRMKNTRVVR